MEKEIGVYTKDETFLHKLRMISNPEIEVFWSINYNDKRLRSLEEAIGEGVTEPKRLWVATNGKWSGYFIIKWVNGNELILGSWHGKDNYPERNPFQGYTYKVPRK